MEGLGKVKVRYEGGEKNSPMRESLVKKGNVGGRVGRR